MSDTYVESRNGVLYVRGSRVPLESLVWPWPEGHSAEEIQEAYSTLTLAEVYGALAYYLDHRSALDQDMRESMSAFEDQRTQAEASDPTRYTELRRRVAAAKARRLPAGPVS